MFYRLLLLLALLFSGLFTHAQGNANSQARTDASYRNGSGIKEIWLHDNKVKELANLGMLWGFIKYYHANVNKGQFYMDAALFRVLPQVLAAANTDSANAIMERWVDGFGKPEVCGKCKPFKKTETTHLEPDYGRLFIENNLPKTLQEKLEYIRQNRYTASKHHYIEPAPMINNPEFTNEMAYENNPFPDAGTRLLALFRYWNMIQYFYPNRHLIGEDWNRALGQMIPDFCNATDLLSYHRACRQMIVRINDSHAGLNTDALSQEKGLYITPFSAEFIEDKLVVTGYYKDTAGIKNQVKPGDVIEQINGSSIIDIIRKYLAHSNGSNYERKLYLMAHAVGFILRSTARETRLSISRDGTAKDIVVSNIVYDSATCKNYYWLAPAQGYRILPGNVGYLYPARLEDKDIEAIRDSFTSTKGIIIDMRCYPNVFMPFNYGKWLKPTSSPFVKFTNMSVDMPGTFETTKPLENGGGKGTHYNGKIVILVNARTQSSAEYQTMALQTAPGAKVIGSQTSGADGNISWITLPGGLKTAISGIGVLYPDGTESQRAGVKIDKEVRPTIKGVREGIDEVLEEAIRMIKN